MSYCHKELVVSTQATKYNIMLAEKQTIVTMSRQTTMKPNSLVQKNGPHCPQVGPTTAWLITRLNIRSGHWKQNKYEIVTVIDKEAELTVIVEREELINKL